MKDINTDNTYDTWLSKHGGYASSITLRDYFAAKAMQSMLPLFSDRPLKEIQEVPTKAYAMADLMLKAREQ